MTTSNQITSTAAQDSNVPVHDVRFEQLKAWAGATLKRSDLLVTAASEDASFRRYFRASATGETWIVMDAPPEKENLSSYIHIAQMLNEAGINAPQIVARDIEAGYLLVSDLGACTYLMALEQRERADALYGDAIAALVKMQVGCAPRSHELPEYDAALLLREMQLFSDWFLSRHLGIELDNTVAAQLQTVFNCLATAALSQPRVFVHRDYHSRNLMAVQTAAHGVNPGVLDFQDAVLGPITYDLASLLRDCYIDWPLARVHEWIHRYCNAAAQTGLNTGQDNAEFVRWFDLMGVQRHLKAIGIFARLWHRDGKRGYLRDIPRTLNYVQYVSSNYPELRLLAQLLDAKVLPALARL
jgi:aminoglycoside/choline kinase family phosphotransferase